MTATVIAGSDLGLLDSSLHILKRQDKADKNGNIGGGSNLFVNASNGNLILQQKDAFLPSMGEDFNLVRTYNSQAGLRGESSWRMSFDISLRHHGSDIIVERGDQSRFDFKFDNNISKWVSTDGAKAYETLEKVHNKKWPFRDHRLDESISGELWFYVLTRADQTKLYFDASGKLKASVDKNGVRMDYLYHLGCLKQIRDDNGHQINFQYDGWGNLVKITDETSEVLVEYRYHHGRLTEVIDRNGHRTRYYYTSKGLLNRIDLPNQQMVNGQLQTFDDRHIEFGYTFGGISSTYQGLGYKLSSIKNAEGGLTTFEYFNTRDASHKDIGGRTRIVDALGNARAYSNEAEYVQWRTDHGFYAHYDRRRVNQTILYYSRLIREKHATVYKYAENGSLQELIDQQGYRTQYNYNHRGDLVSASDKNAWAVVHSDNAYYRGLRQSMGYVDAAGQGILAANLTTQQKTQLKEAYTSHYQYDCNGNLVRFIDNNDTNTVFTYDDHNNLLSSVSGEHLRLERDNSTDAQEKRAKLGFAKEVSQLTQFDLQRLQDLFTTRFKYDANHNLVERIDNGGDITRYQYDSYGNMTKKIVYLDHSDLQDVNKQQVTQYFYDAFGNNIETLDAEGNRTYAQYDHFGNIVRKIDGNGGVTSYIYDDDNRLTSQTDAEGNVTSYAYDAVGNMISTTDENGHTVIRVYDKNNRLLSIIDPSDKGASDNRIIEYGYDIVGDRISVKDAQGHTTRYVYDARHQLIKLTTPNVKDQHGTTKNYVSSYHYDALGRVISENDKNGNTTSYVYNQDGLLIQKKQADGHTTHIKYDENGSQIRVISGVHLPEARRQILKFVHDEENQLIEQTDAEGNTTKYALDAVGNRSSVTDANGHTTQFEYDGKNRLLTILSPEVTSPKTGQPVVYSQSFTYDANGNVVSKTDENNHTSKYHFDKNNRNILVEDTNGIFTRYSYDAKGQRTKIEIGVDMARDGSGKLINLENQTTGQSEYKIASQDHAKVVRYEYDEFGQLIRQADGMGNALINSNLGIYKKIRKDLGFGELKDNLSAADKKAIADLYSTKFEYDKSGNLIKKTDAEGRATQFQYDALNRAIRTINALNGSVTTAYDGNGNAVRIVDELGRVTEQSFDTQNRVVKRTIAKGTDAEKTTDFSYDSFGNLTAQVDASGTSSARETRYEYDLNNRKIKSINAENDSVSYAYDAVGNRILVTDAKGHQTRYEYDARNKNIKIIDPLTFNTRYEYDGAGNRIAVIDANNHRIQYEFDPGNRMVKIVQKMDDGQDRITEYGYDVRGNQVRMKTAAGTAHEQLTTFTYDAENKLRQIEDAEGGITTHDYDRAYNKTQTTDANGNSTHIAYDALNRKVSVTDANQQVTTIEYDAVGNTVSITDAKSNRTEYEYDGQNRRIIERDPLNIETHYSHDTIGNKTSITYAHGTVNAVTERFEYFADGQLKARVDGTGARTEYTYDANNNRISMTDPEGYATHYTLDSNNRVTAITDPEGGVVRYVYDAKGNRIQVIDQEGNKTTSYYNAADQVEWTIDAEGYATQHTYDENGNRVASTLYLHQVGVPSEQQPTTKPTVTASAKDQTTRYEYDGLNRLIKTIDAESFSTRYTYDAVGNRLSVSQDLTANGLSVATTYSYYDAVNRMVASVSAEGTLTRYEYDSVGNRTKTHRYDTLVSVNGNNMPTPTPNDSVRTTELTYDAANRVIQSKSALGHITQYRYDKRGNRTETVTAVGLTEQRITRQTYDAANRVTATINAFSSAEQVTTSFTYYADGQIKTRTDAHGSSSEVTTEFFYDKNNRLVEQRKPNGQGGKLIDTFEYDGAGNRIVWNNAVGTSEARTYQYQYDHKNQLTQETLPFKSGQSIVNRYQYDGAGNRIHADLAVGTPETRQQTWGFDKNNRVISAINSLNIETRYQYDGAGNRILELQNANGHNGEPVRQTQHQYDLDNRLTKTTTAEGEETTYTYNAHGDKTQESKKVSQGRHATTHFYYDQLGRQTQRLSGEGHLTEYQFDAHGNVLSTRTYFNTFSVPASGNVQGSGRVSTVENTYNQLNQLVSVTHANGRIDQFTYDARGNRTQEVLGANVVGDSGPRITQYQFDDANHLITKEEQLNSGITRTTAYTVDALGQVIARVDAKGSGQERTTRFEYNQQGKLIVESRVVGVINQQEQLATSTFTYNAFGDLTQKTLASGAPEQRVLTYQYDNGGRLELFTNGESEKTHYRYDAMGNQRFVTTAYGTNDARTQEMRYDLDNRLVTSVDGEGIETRYEYNGLNKQTAVIVASGTPDEQRTQMAYDDDGRLVLKTDAMGFTTDYKYDGLNNQILMRQMVDKATNGQPARYAFTHQYFDQAGRQTHTINSEGYLTAYEYDQFDQLLINAKYLDKVVASEQTPSPAANAPVQTTRYQYDMAGNKVQETDALGHVSHSRYDILGRRTELHQAWNANTGKGERITLFAYNALDQLVSRTEGAQTSQQTETRFTYNLHGELVLQQDAFGDSAQRDQRFSYDDAGRIAFESRYYTDAQGTQQEHRTTFAYDAAGNVSVKREGHWDAQNQSLDVLRQTTYEYDHNNRIVSETNGENETTRYEYDGAGNRKVVRQGYGTPDQRNQFFTYTDLNQVHTVTDGEGVVTEYRYDGLGNKVQTVQAKGVTGQERNTHYAYDLNGRLVSVIDPENNRTQYTYDHLGNQTTIVDANGGVQHNAFDALGRQYITVSAGGVKTVVKYDALGNKIEEVQGWDGGSLAASENTQATSRVTVTFEYDALGRQTLLTDGNGFSTRMEYDAVGNQTRIIKGLYLGNDADKKAKEHITENAFTYDQAGRMLSMSVGAVGATPNNRNITTYSYNAVGDRLSMTEAANGFKNTQARITTYTYDLAGRKTQTTTNGGSITRLTYTETGDVKSERILQSSVNNTQVWIETTKEYDGNGRVTDETDGMGNITHYEYDKLGNRTDVFTAYQTSVQRHTRMAYDANNRKVSSTDGEGNVTRYEYDAIGNQIQVTDALGRKAYYYFDANNKMIAMVDGEGSVSQFGYNAQGNQVSSRVLATVIDMSAVDEQKRTEYSVVSGKFVLTNNDRLTATNFDATGKKVSEKLADNSIHTYDYDAVGNLLKETKFANVVGGERVTEYQYDLDNRLVHFVDVDGDTINRFEYDAVGNKVAQEIKLKSDANYVRRTEFTYNLNNQKTKQVSDVGGLNITQIRELDVTGNEVGFINANGQRSTKTFDLNNRVKTITDAEGHTIINTYDAVGNRISVTNAKGHTTNFEFDNNNRQTKVILPAAEHYRLNANKKWVSVNERATSTTVYDAFGNKVQEIDSEGYKTTRWFDANGRKVAELNADNVYMEYEYNSFGDVAAEKRYSEKVSGQNAHNIQSQPNLANANVYRTDMAYDALGRVTEKTYPEIEVTQVNAASGTPAASRSRTRPVERFTYDAYGNQATVTDKNGNISYQFYDALNRQIALIDPAGFLTEWHYDAQGNVLEQLKYNATVNTQNVNTLAPGQFTFTGGDNSFDQVSRRYDNANRMISETTASINLWSRQQGASSARIKTTFGYDDEGNQISRTRAFGTANQVTEYFLFDANNRKVGFVDKHRILSSYQYDANGNVTLQSRYANALAGSVDVSQKSLSELQTIVGSSADDQSKTSVYDTNNRLTSESTELGEQDINKSYRYDSRGKQTSVTQHERTDLASKTNIKALEFKGDQETRSVYDGMGQLIRTVSPDGTGSVMEYDVFGNQTLVYTGEIDSVPSMPSGISMTASEETLNISWSGNERAFIVYDNQSHTVNGDNDFSQLLSQYANRSAVSANNVNLALQPGDIRYFRVVTVDVAGNYAVGSEQVAFMPPRADAIEVKEESGQHVLYTTFDGAVDNPKLNLDGQQINLQHVAGNQYKTVLPALNTVRQSYTVTWDFNGASFRSDSIKLNTTKLHHLFKTDITPSAVGSDYNVSTAISATGNTNLSDYDTLTIRWVNTATQQEYVGNVSVRDNPSANGKYVLDVGSGSETLAAGDYRIEIRGFKNGKEDLLQVLDHTLNNTAATYDKLSMALPNAQDSAAIVIINNEPKEAFIDNGYLSVDVDSSIASDYTVLSGYRYGSAHSLAFDHSKVMSVPPQGSPQPPQLLGYNSKMTVGFSPSEAATIQGNVTFAWREVGQTTFTHSQSVSVDANGRATLNLPLAGQPLLQDQEYDIKVSYTNAQGQEVLVDWLQFNAAHADSSQQSHSLVAVNTERQGVFNANSIGTGLSTDAAVVTQPDYNVATTTSDNKQGLVIKTGRDTGYFVENRYNALGQLIATNKGNGSWREYGVDAMGNQVHQIEKGREDNVDSNSWRHSYKAFDGMSRQTHSWMAHNGGYTVHQQTYNYNGKVVKDIQTDGSIIEHIYNGVGQKTAELHKTSSGISLREQHWRYDALGNQTRHTDLMGRGVEKQYDAQGKLTHEFVANNDHDGVVLKEYRYDDFGRRISTIEHMSANASATTKTTTYEYDRADRLIKQISGRLNGQPYATTFLLDSRGNRVMVTTPNDNGTLKSIDIYDEFGRVITHIGQHGAHKTYERKTYDIFGNLILQSDAEGRLNIKTYGEFGRLRRETDADGRDTVYEYDAFGNIRSIIKDAATLTNADGTKRTRLERIKIVKTYDEQNRLLTVSEYLGSTETLGINTQYTYDARGNRATEVIKNGHANGNTNSVVQNVTYTYNQANELTRWYDSVSQQALNKTYNGAGQLVHVYSDPQRTGPSPQDVNYTTNIRYEYTDAGKLERVYSWNKDNHSLELTDRYSYHENGLIKESYKDGVTRTFQYNARGDVTRSDWVQDNKAHYAKWTYDNRGNVISYATYRVEEKTFNVRKYKPGTEDNIVPTPMYPAGTPTQKTLTRHVKISDERSEYISGTNLARRSESWRGLEVVSGITQDSNPELEVESSESLMYNIWRDGVYRDDPEKDPYQNAALSGTYARQGITNSKDNDNSSVTTTNYNRVGNALHVDIRSNSHIWTDTHYSRGGVRLEEVLDGASSRKSYVATTKTTFEYDGNGKLAAYQKQKGTGDERPERREFIYNNDGQVLERKIFDKTKANGHYTTNYHYANGNAIGSSGQNEKGESEVQLGTGDFGLVKHLGDRFPTSALSSFTATGGETLRQVAGMLLGNSNLWFILAEANGLQASDQLKEGQTITIPNSVQTAELDADSHKVYNESEIHGSTMPNVRQEKKSDSCGNFLAIVITIAVLVIASAATGGAAALIATSMAGSLGAGTFAAFAATVVLSTLAGAAIYAGLNIVQQSLMISLGLQEEFSWKQVGDQAIQGAFAGAVAGMGGFAGEAGTLADSTKVILNISKAAANVAGKAVIQMRNNDGKINNYTGLVMAALPAFGGDVAEFTASYGDYASPWLSLAEKAYKSEDPITRDDYLMAIGNTAGAALGSIGRGEGEDPFSFANIRNRLGAQALLAGTLYSQVDNKDLALNYLANSVGQEVGGLGVQHARQAMEKARLDREERQRRHMQGKQFEDAIRDMSVDVLAKQNPGMTKEELRQLKQDLKDGTVESPKLKLINKLLDGEGNKALGAFDKDKNTIYLDRATYEQAQQGDVEATSRLLTTYIEEQSHAVANIMEQRLGIEDFKYDEGGRAAKAMVEELTRQGEHFQFSLNVGNTTTDFMTTASALQDTLRTQFTAARLLSDRQSGSMEFSSTNTELSKDQLTQLNYFKKNRERIESMGMTEQDAVRLGMSLEEASNSFSNSYEQLFDEAIAKSEREQVKDNIRKSSSEATQNSAVLGSIDESARKLNGELADTFNRLTNIINNSRSEITPNAVSMNLGANIKVGEILDFKYSSGDLLSDDSGSITNELEFKSKKHKTSVNTSGSIKGEKFGINNLLSDNQYLSAKTSPLTSLNVYKNGDIGLAAGTKKIGFMQGKVESGAFLELKVSTINIMRKAPLFNFIYNMYESQPSFKAKGE